MPLTLAQRYSDPEQLESVYVAPEVEITPTGRGSFQADVTRLELEQIWLLRVYEALPRIKWAAQPAKRAFIRFHTGLGSDVIIDGTSLKANELVYHGLKHNYYEYSSGPSHTGGVSVPVEHLMTVGAAVSGCDLNVPREAKFITPPTHVMASLRILHAEAGVLAQKAPHILDIPEVARGLEQALMHTVVSCLSERDHRASSWAQQCHDTIMRRFRRALEEHPDRALYVPEICAAIGVPERTLRLCCRERLQMSPKQYLILRRMHLARRVLNASGATDMTVTDVATRFGFWHFGRFAGTYREIFGEPPSVTLGREPS